MQALKLGMGIDSDFPIRFLFSSFRFLIRFSISGLHSVNIVGKQSAAQPRFTVKIKKTVYC